ncbi:MAG TPA: amidohydrolase family protein [Anaerolineales bacterium]|nr:amidohydrolase family protein [Anaerolineales bacterium]
MIRLPGLIDVHVHLREPGGEHKEDFDSGTAAALAGGFTAVLAMPNTRPPLTDAPTLDRALAAARKKSRCDYGVYLGAGADNVSNASTLARRACGLKLYLDQTYGPLRLDDLGTLHAHVRSWPKDRPLAAHAEGRSLAAVLLLGAVVDRPVHICHVSRRDEIALIRAAKERGLAVTCEVAPHHLLFTAADLSHLPPGRREVRPQLNDEADRQALWDHLGVIDCFASDHAPHTAAEKDSDQPPPGFPGLETFLGLLWLAVADGRLGVDDLVQKLDANPRRIFGLGVPGDTYVEVDPDSAWDVHAGDLHSRCGWTPYEGMRLRARVRRVTLRGKIAYEDGTVLSAPGSGRELSPGSTGREAFEAI